MIGILGRAAILLAFFSSLTAIYFYYRAAAGKEIDTRLERWGNIFFGLLGLSVLTAGGLLMYLVLSHSFQYYYVYEYTSRDLPLKYLISAFYSGQEGSFLLWIFLTSLVGAGLIKWTRKDYRAPVMLFMSLAEAFVLTMVLGVSIGSIHIGASPFRTLSEAMPNAPFLKANPGFIPTDGNGLNDLLRSPWILIHPPILFLGFSLMTVPFAFAMSALWKRKYTEWIRPALPWTLGANLCLLTALFLGGYWAYVTLSFGGYWAWDPVENAALVPWLFGVAGIHTMMIQQKKSTPRRSSLLLAIFAYMGVVYETFLTRSGILGNSSVHSFVDLGLYNQLLIYMLVISVMGLGLYFYRYRELPKPESSNKFLNREFITFSGAMMLFLIGLVVLIGTSSPIIGKLFVSNPTPPIKSFYDNWTMPLAIVAAILTVLGQYMWWKKYDAESLSAELLTPLLITSVLSLITIIWGGVRNIEYMVYLFAAWFALVGNSFVLYRLYRKKPKLIGGSLTHIGFAVLLIGILASSAFDQTLLDSNTMNYNAAVKAGKVKDKNGAPVINGIDFFELKMNKPTVVGKKWVATYTGMVQKNGDHPGEQVYSIKFEPKNGNGETFTMHPIVYPMLQSSTPNSVNWAVNPMVKMGLTGDIYMYVAGSSYVEQINNRLKKNQQKVGPVSDTTSTGQMGSSEKDTSGQTLIFHRGDQHTLGHYIFTFENFQKATPAETPDSAIVAVHAIIQVEDTNNGTTKTVTPLYAVIKKGDQNYSYAPPVKLSNWGIQVQFASVKPMSDQIQLHIQGVQGGSINENPWVVLVAETKPFISLVWLGVFILMAGFIVSISRRHWENTHRTNLEA